MKLSEVKNILETIGTLNFELPNGSIVPEHFHVTEVGMITKNFIDCGGTIRRENVVNFQLWNATDTDHRLEATKLLNIIKLSENLLNISDEEIEVEYQTDTIGKFGLDFNGQNFVLTSKQTTCLASEKCGNPSEKIKINLADLTPQAACCTPGGGCC
jgi:hypothetical protein